MIPELPLVSIITPSFNKGPYIEETIQSIRNQTYKNIEHIVFDAGSTDETISILKKYGEHLQWISEPDKGQSDAINKGWRLAKGKIIAYLNADDTYLPDAVESAVAFFEKNPDVQMLYGDGIITDEYGNNKRLIKHGEFKIQDLVFCRDMVFQPSVFLRKGVFDSIGDVDVNLHLAMDLDYWLRTALVYKTAYLPKPLSVAKIYQDAKSSALMFRYVKEYEYILEKLFKSASIPPDILHYKNNAYTYIYTKGGLDYLHAMMMKDGMSYLWKAFRMSPVRCVANVLIFSGEYGFRKIQVFMNNG
jgi:glycosyltransferase involved in cell wall biosynthesis